MVGTELEILYQLLIALGIGLLIGVERGWQKRDSRDGQRIAGVRTHGLIALLGGAIGLLTEQFGGELFGFAFVAVGLVIASTFVMRQRQSGIWGITSLMAALLTFVLAVLAVTADALIAASIAVVAVLLLGYKPVLHSWISQIKEEELKAVISLLLMSVVMLPLLPNEGVGPWQALNPFKIWLMVIIIASISFVGYVAVKLAGAQRGILFTGLFGGLASSTAVTLHFSRLSQQHKTLVPIIASGILIACGSMYWRILVITGLIAPNMLSSLWLPMLVMAAITYAPLVFYRRAGELSLTTEPLLKNPLELKAAFVFGMILVLVMLLSVLLRQWYGDAGLISLAAISGMANVDAILLSLIEQSHGDVSVPLFVTCCVVAAASNNVLKALLCSAIGAPPLLFKSTLPLLLSALVGMVLVWMM